MNTSEIRSIRLRECLKNLSGSILVGVVSISIGMTFLHAWHWNLSIPFVYLRAQGDETWQFILTKALMDTGWVLNNPFLGAPDVAHWYNNAAAQTSALHSVLMLGLSKFIHNAVEVQQLYFILNFGLISAASFIACRLLGVAWIPAFCIGIAFSLLGYRFNFIIYAFLANYFAVPLALVAVFWIMIGEFAKPFQRDNGATMLTLRHMLLSSKFFLGLCFVTLVALSDGYYAFFTLLLLGFATAIRALSGDIRRLVNFTVPVIYMAALLVVSLGMALPLNAYKQNHPAEFAPNGIEDPSLVKHAFEAEVYSVSLKLLLAPSPNHRVKELAVLGQKMVDTSEAARQFKIGAPYVVLGLFGSIFFLGALLLLAIPRLNKGAYNALRGMEQVPEDSLLRASILLAFFIFLCSISGGVGTLIALVYPTIRAYDRFPLFLLFVLYVGAGAVATSALRYAKTGRQWGLYTLMVLITALSLFDQIPRDAAKGNAETKGRFLAEQTFVGRVENDLPPGAMVYQYPYSQWLTDSPYYGWGSFAQIRLYLFSKKLHWSNGASKNSPVDDWHARLSQLPIDQLITEMQAAGFKAVVVDRRVVPPAEYQRVRKALLEHASDTPIEDETGKLAFFKLQDPGYRIFYDESYREVRKLVIYNRDKTLTSPLSRLIDATRLKMLLASTGSGGDLVIERATHPEVFYSEAKLDRGFGDRPILPTSVMQGQIRCSVVRDGTTDASNRTLTMTIENKTDFDWRFNQGPFPLGIGVHLRGMDGALLNWDDGTRLRSIAAIKGSPDRFVIPHGESIQLRYSFAQLNLSKLNLKHRDVIADFSLVQDRNAWFENLGCKLPLAD